MSVAERLARVRSSVNVAAEISGRAAEAVTIVAVTKTVPVEKIREAVDAGQRLLGENRVQEAQPKIVALAEVRQTVRWHLIGHLQSNKATAAVDCFDVIQSVDSLKIAQRLDELGSKASQATDVLLEVNVAGETSKFGFAPDALRQQLGTLSTLSQLRIRGLMTVAPQTTDPEVIRWVFRAMAHLRDDLQQRSGLACLSELSMGMSADFRVAIEEGATMVRIGSAIFGPRGPIRESSGR